MHVSSRALMIIADGSTGVMAFNHGGWRCIVTWALITTIVSPVFALVQEEGITSTVGGSHVPIKCYQCNSWSDEGCSNLKANGSAEHYLKECTDDYEGDQPFCRKTVQAIKGHAVRVIRSCGWMRHPEDCYHTDDDHHIENVCQCYTDACNEASRRRGVIVLLAVALLACKTLV